MCESDGGSSYVEIEQLTQSTRLLRDSGVLVKLTAICIKMLTTIALLYVQLLQTVATAPVFHSLSFWMCNMTLLYEKQTKSTDVSNVILQLNHKIYGSIGCSINYVQVP